MKPTIEVVDLEDILLLLNEFQLPIEFGRSRSSVSDVFEASNYLWFVEVPIKSLKITCVLIRRKSLSPHFDGLSKCNVLLPLLKYSSKKFDFALMKTRVTHDVYSDKRSDSKLPSSDRTSWTLLEALYSVFMDDFTTSSSQIYTDLFFSYLCLTSLHF